MNRENLSSMADYIETIPQEKFDMNTYRRGESVKHACGSVGCILGHCTILDERPLPVDYYADIAFASWSLEFTGLNPNSDEWDYLFSSFWTYGDNTPTGAAKRIRHFLEKGLPQDWHEQMHGRAPLSYMTD